MCTETAPIEIVVAALSESEPRSVADVIARTAPAGLTAADTRRLMHELLRYSDIQNEDGEGWTLT